MPAHARQSTRIIVVGGGIAGLSSAIRLGQAGFPVTVIEASELGFCASTRNQGWLLSGAWFAPQRRDLAQRCYESLQHTLRFCPESIEPNCGPMVYLAEEPETDLSHWTSAWEAAGIPFSGLSSKSLFERFPRLAISRASEAFQLPDRAIQTSVLLRRMAAAAEKLGVEIRTGTTVTKLIYRGDSVQGVQIAHRETIPARLVILAGNATGGFLYPEHGTEAVAAQPQVALVAQKTHLLALRPEISRHPLCIIDAGGFNHLPHPPSSVFGSNRWLLVRDSENEQVDAEELAHLWDQVRRFFPDVRRADHEVVEWAGTTVQAMHLEQIEPGQAPLPTVVDHQLQYPAVKNLLSVFPGRASLWPYLAEQTRQAVLQKMEPLDVKIATPPWGVLTTAH